MYEPKPIDTTNIELSIEIGELIERLAENNHDLWAKQRMKDGWTYGEKRDDVSKKHPCLTAYDHLPDSEKEYDRIMAREVLKTIQALGYELVRKK